MKSRLFLILISIALITGCSAQKEFLAGRQDAQVLDTEVTKHVEIQYLLYLPEDYKADGDKWPLILFLHGSGERGSDINKVKIHGPAKLIENGKQFPFVIISPQCPEDTWWDADNLDALLNDITENYNVDINRIYLTGLSMGGYGTWAMAIKYPDRFAALAPICGGGDARHAKVLKDVPVWVFHGGKDNVVPVAEGQAMVDAIKQAGGDPKFTIYPEAGHDSWTETYNNPELYEWFLKQKRTK